MSSTASDREWLGPLVAFTSSLWPDFITKCDFIFDKVKLNKWCESPTKFQLISWMCMCPKACSVFLEHKRFFLLVSDLSQLKRPLVIISMCVITCCTPWNPQMDFHKQQSVSSEAAAAGVSMVGQSRFTYVVVNTLRDQNCRCGSGSL